MHADSSSHADPDEGKRSDPNVPGLCIIVTPPDEPVPRALADALAHHDATPVRARSPYHAIVEVARPTAGERCTLLIVEPERCPHADNLALAAMAHAPDIAVWRYDPRDDAPVAPYVPDKPGVVPEPIEELDDTYDDAPVGSIAPPPPPRPPQIVEDTAPDDASPPPPASPEASANTPLVSHDELAMLLGHDDPREPDR